ncbi:MAG TPA: trehalase family glycosidase [Allosphingosinicella sp.]|nr:trehalase family glycosidase [Allosphingosinicella sp.]
MRGGRREHAGAAFSAPSVLYPRLFARLDEGHVALDKKLIADARPRAEAMVIEAEVARLSRSGEADLAALLGTWFDLPGMAGGGAAACDPRLADCRLEDWIERLWGDLIRHDAGQPSGSSLIPLPHPYVVPGGMFRECYYWDSYFVLLGLRRRPHLARGMVDNLAFLIDRHGFIPNGNRTYYLSRSQPPLFYAAVAESGLGGPSDCWAHYLPRLRAEHAFWMSGAEALGPGEAARRVIRMADGALLNLYHDDDPRPRDEGPSGRDAAIAAGAADRAAHGVFRDIRAACESGWDFSSRWFGDRRSIETIRTTAIVPVDLNAFLFGLENAIARGAIRRGDRGVAADFSAKAERRRVAMTTWLWNEAAGLFDDYDVEHGLRGAVTAAALAPLFTRLATRDQARLTAQRVKAELLAPGGLLATPRITGEQWDAPNGWAPLQWIAAIGLRQYGQRALAKEIVRRWVATVARVYAETGRLTEKYDVVDRVPGGGGEYALQDGFGWTNAVTIALIEEFPDACASVLSEAAHDRLVVRNPDSAPRGETIAAPPPVLTVRS